MLILAIKSTASCLLSLPRSCFGVSKDKIKNSIAEFGLLTPIELQTTFMNLPTKGLQESARALANALNSASECEQRELYWTNRIKPFWKEIWPKSQSSTDPSLAKPLVRLVIAAGNKFPEALKVI